jgi:hypothetical protein
MANMFNRLRTALNKVWRRASEPPRVEGGDATTSDMGPGALTPSRVASDAQAGASQPGSAITRPTEPGSSAEEGRATGQ